MNALLLPILLAAVGRQEPAPAPAPAQTPSSVAWADKSLADALAEARTSTRLVMAWVRAESNDACARMEREVFSSERGAAALAGTACLRLDLARHKDALARYAVKDAPVTLWFNPDGSVRERVNGYGGSDSFLADVARVKLDVGTIDDLRRRVAAKGDDLDLRYDLHRRLTEVGDTRGALEQKTAILKADPQMKSRGSRYFRYERITGEIEEHWARTGALNMAKVAELQAFVELETEPWIVWDGWMRLSNTHDFFASQAAKQGRAEDAKKERSIRRDYLARAWRGIPEEQDLLHQWCFQYAELFWEQRDELSPADQEFLLALTRRTVQLFEGEALAHDLRARALHIAGKREEALEAAKKAAELEPTNPNYRERVKSIEGK